MRELEKDRDVLATYQDAELVLQITDALQCISNQAPETSETTADLLDGKYKKRKHLFGR